MKSKFWVIGFFVLSLFLCSAVQSKTIEERLSLFAPQIFSDSRIDSLASDTQELLGHLIAAGMIVDSIFFDQMHPMNLTWLSRLSAMAENDPAWRPYIQYLNMSYGPWDSFFEEEWIFPESFAPQWPKLKGRNFFPIDRKDESFVSVSKEDLDAWLVAHPEDRTAFKSSYTMIRRHPQTGDFVAIPYSEYYRQPMSEVAWHLEQAATLTDDPDTIRLLMSRAESFRNNNFNQTEAFWIKSHDTQIALVIGPYEEYEDEYWAVKRGFQVRVGLKDPQGTAELQQYKSLGAKFQANLPIDPKFVPDQPKAPHFTVLNEIYLGGMGRLVVALADKIPNDKEITLKYGARQSYYKNSLEGKCELVLKPIAEVVLASQWQPYVACDSFVKFTLHHEYAHALGPMFYYPDYDNPTVDSRQPFDEKLENLGPPLEELKADTLGLYNRQWMLDKGLETTEDGKLQMYSTLLAGLFRSVRFGASSPYRKGAMVIMNKLVELGAASFDPAQEGRITFDAAKMPDAFRKIIQMVLMLQVNGDKAAVEAMYAQYGDVPEGAKVLLERVNSQGIPRDLYPVFPAVEMLLPK